MTDFDDGILAFLWRTRYLDYYGKELFPGMLYIMARTTSDSLKRLLTMGGLEGVQLHPYTNCTLDEVFKNGRIYRKQIRGKVFT